MVARGTARRLLLTGGGVAIAIAAGRLSGLVREVVLARAAGGATPAADMAVVILGFPDFLVSLVVSGALTAVLVPELQRSDSRRAAALFVQSALVVGGMMSAIAIAIALSAPWVIHALAPGFDAETVAHAAPPFRLMLWSVPLAGLTCVTTAWLNSSERFFIAASATLMANMAIIACLLQAVNSSMVPLAVAAGILIGSGLRLLSQLIPSRDALSVAALKLEWVVDSAMTWRYAHALGATSLLLLMPVIGRAIASLVNPGAVALFNYANKLVELPLGVAITVIATILFPRFSRLLVEPSTRERAIDLLTKGLQVMLLVSLAFTLPCVWFAHEIAAVVFGLATMSHQDVRALADVAAVGFCSLVPQGIATLMIGVLNADADNRAVLRRVGLAVGVFAASGFIAATSGGLSFLMFALVATYVVLVVALVRRATQRFGTNILRNAMSAETVRAVLLSLLSGAVVAWGGSSFTNDPVLRVVIAVASGGIMLVTGLGLLSKFRKVLASGD